MTSLTFHLVHYYHMITIRCVSYPYQYPLRIKKKKKRYQPLLWFPTMMLLLLTTARILHTLYYDVTSYSIMTSLATLL